MSNCASSRRTFVEVSDTASSFCKMILMELEGQRNHYRLRVGIYRILFRIDAGKIEVYAVKQRKDAYE